MKYVRPRAAAGEGGLLSGNLGPTEKDPLGGHRKGLSRYPELMMLNSFVANLR